MIEFIVVNKMPFKEIIISEIEKVMNDFSKVYKKDYKIKKFDDYNKAFSNEINKKNSSYRIYILNICEDSFNKKCSMLRRIKKNQKDAEIIVTTKDDINSLLGLSFYAFKILNENSTSKFRTSIYNTLYSLNSYNKELLKIYVIENDILHVINIEDIISIEKNIVKNIVTIETKNKMLISNHDYYYLKSVLHDNFVETHNLKLVNIDYININKLDQNSIVVSRHTRKRYDKTYKKTIIKRYESREIDDEYIKEEGIPLSTFKGWLKIYGRKNNANIRIETKVKI